VTSVVVADDGVARCWWAGEDPGYRRYHDAEWGRTTLDDRALFEKLVLEGFQAGLSWATILRKRDRFREVFAGFEPSAVAGFGESDVLRLLDDRGIIRHRGKIEAAVGNARRALDVIEEFGSLAAYVWRWARDEASVPETAADLPAQTERSRELAKDLKRRGWAFVGPTTVYAFMQAMGLVNDHLAGCDARSACEKERLAALAGIGW
jgi:DNA-3-methyladenine glycosylase I